MSAQSGKPLFLFKSYSWPNQIWSWGDGWLHFRETTPLRDPGSPRITNGFLIIFHHPILCLSLILPMIPETSRELHLNLANQSRPGSSLSRTCLTAPNTLCVHRAGASSDRHGSASFRHCPPSLPVSLCHLHRRAASDKLPRQMTNFFLSLHGGFVSAYTWWSSSSPKSWWAFPPSHGWDSHTWLLEDFPGHNLKQISLQFDPLL